MTPSRLREIRCCLSTKSTVSRTTALPNEEILWLLDQAEALERIRSNNRRRSKEYRQRNPKEHPADALEHYMNDDYRP